MTGNAADTFFFSFYSIDMSDRRITTLKEIS